MFRRMLIIIFLVFIERNAFNLMSTFRMNKYNLFLCTQEGVFNLTYYLFKYLSLYTATKTNIETN